MKEVTSEIDKLKKIPKPKEKKEKKETVIDDSRGRWTSWRFGVVGEEIVNIFTSCCSFSYVFEAFGCVWMRWDIFGRFQLFPERPSGQDSPSVTALGFQDDSETNSLSI